MNYELKQATINDLDDIVELFDKYRIFYGQKSDIDAAKKFIYEKFEHRESIIFIAKDLSSNKVLGFTQLYPVFSSISMQRSLVLNDLFVLDEFRKIGIAELLMKEAKSYGKKINSKGIELSTAKDNFAAQSLYKKLSYEKDEDFFHYFLSLK